MHFGCVIVPPPIVLWHHRRRALMASGNWILASFDPYTFSHSQGQELTSTSFAHDVRKNPKEQPFCLSVAGVSGTCGVRWVWDTSQGKAEARGRM